MVADLADEVEDILEHFVGLSSACAAAAVSERETHTAVAAWPDVDDAQAEHHCA